MIRELARPAGAADSRPPLRIQRQPLLPAGPLFPQQGWVGRFVACSMARLITIGVAIVSCLLVWKSGAINSVLPGQQPAPPPLDAGPVISKRRDAMESLKNVHLTVAGK